MGPEGPSFAAIHNSWALPLFIAVLLCAFSGFGYAGVG